MFERLSTKAIKPVVTDTVVLIIVCAQVCTVCRVSLKNRLLIPQRDLERLSSYMTLDLCETGCLPGMFSCNNFRCIQGWLVCDGDDDCGNGSDERNCSKGSLDTGTSSNSR